MKIDFDSFFFKYKLLVIIIFIVLCSSGIVYGIIALTMPEKWLAQAWEMADEQGHVTKIIDDNIDLIHSKVSKAALFGNDEAKLYNRMPSVRMGKSLLRKAERGNADAQFAIGFLFRFYDVFLDKLQTKDQEEAGELGNWLKGQRSQTEVVQYMWFLKAANQGHIRAKLFIDLYPEAKALYDDFQQQWTAAQNGDPKAMYAIGRYYSDHNNPVSKDDNEALRWTEIAADAGCTEALYDLADAYIGGFGSSTRLHLKYDREKAVALFKKGAELGDVNAYYGLGRCYEEGLGVKRNLKEAEKWLVKAVASGGGRNAYKADNHLKSVRYQIANEQRIKRR